MGTGSQPSLWEELENLRAPMLAVAGELDRKFVGIARGMAERSSRISIQITPGAGHNVRVEAPGEYSKLLGEFLEAGKLK
jgi:2-succinyl-6-hydroxy-2,4-cyclohexadiene-1-carboxylate synthase